MSISTLFVGHSGERLTFDPSAITTLDDLKSFVGQHGIQPRNQILLTAQGKQVRTQTLLTETELFVFDSSRLNSKTGVTSPSSSLSSSGSDFNPGTAPETIPNQSDIEAWQNLFRIRKSWASGLLNGCATRASQAARYQDEQAIIERSLGVAVASLQQHIRTAEQRYAAAQSWSEEALLEQEANVGNWDTNLEGLSSIPARPEFTRFIEPATSHSTPLSQQGNVITLQAFVDATSIRKAEDGAQKLMVGFAQRVSKVREDLESAKKDNKELLRAVEQINANSEVASSVSEPTELLKEIEAVYNKMTSDLQHVQSLPRTPQSALDAAKKALLHTRNYLPNLNEYCSEMNDLVRRAHQQRNSTAEISLEHMRTLSSIESVLAQLYQDMRALELPQDDSQVFHALGIASRLPSVYGALLVESVRRREWVAKMTRDASTLQEEVATYQDEEDKRRKRWARSVEDIVKPEALLSSVLGIEISLQNEGGSWPVVSRDELQDYLNVLSDMYGQSAVTEEMDHAIKDLDKPTRKQIKHAKAFKNGSMHEAAFGDTSLMLRGDEQHRALRETNLRLDEELKGQKSRVRKLEDLLHRQSHVGRTSTGDLFTPQSASAADHTMASPTNLTSQPFEELSSRNSLNDARRLSIQASEEKRLARRVGDLEEELRAAKDEATTRKDSDVDVQKQIEEAMSTKRDLMENMEAQQREFATERRNLEKELAEHKERVEELENEIERIDGEKAGADAQLAGFGQEISRLKNDASGHAARAANEQDARAVVERKLVVADKAKAEAESEMQRVRVEQEQRQDTEAELMQLLATAHAHLSPDAEVPTGPAGLSAALEDLSRRSATHLKDLEEAVAFAKSENESLWSSNERQKTELSAAAQRQSEAENHTRQVKERLDLEEARAMSLEQRLREEQEQLRILRTKFADGETGSEVLRQRVAEEEARAGNLSKALAEANSHINSLDVELMRLQKKEVAYHRTAEESAERLEKRGERAKDVSQRFFAQISRLGRLLERLGLAISYQEDVMMVERASKMGASTSMIDPPGQISRTVTLSSLSPTRKSSTAEEPSDLSVLRWPDAQTAEEETWQFEAYVEQISRFNVDTLSDAVIKRVRDFEYTARKYNKEAKESNKRADAYKERSLKLKSEAHTKIAVKDFKEGDLALFLPTRGQAKGAWAAFNVGCPHYFLAEKDGMRLASRDYIVARINRIEQKVVDLSKTPPQPPDGRSIDETSENAPSVDDDNPFDLSDGLTWWMVHAVEERGPGGAPSTPGLGKSTVAAANVDAKGSIRMKRNPKSDDASRHLNKSLDSRRSSSTSKKGVAANVPTLGHAGSGSPTIATHAEAAADATSGNTGLGIVSDTAPQPTQSDQIRRLSNARPASRTDSPSKARQRSRSPSKSIRSLQRHLEPQSPAKSPAKTPVKKQAWESLWQAEFSLESPSKPGI